MILVAATAMGCGAQEWLSRATDGELSLGTVWSDGWALLHTSRGGSRTVGIICLCAEIVVLASPMVAMWTLALLPIRFIGPRPRRHRIACQPGMIAACAFGVALAAIALQIIGLGLVCGVESVSDPNTLEITLLYSPMVLGVAVVTSWMTLLIGRRWRAERSWIDRFGRAVGCFWIVAGFTMIPMFSVQGLGQPFTVRVSTNSPLPAPAASESQEAVADSVTP